jgi:hypothetical protein
MVVSTAAAVITMILVEEELEIPARMRRPLLGLILVAAGLMVTFAAWKTGGYVKRNTQDQVKE